MGAPIRVRTRHHANTVEAVDDQFRLTCECGGQAGPADTAVTTGNAWDAHRSTFRDES